MSINLLHALTDTKNFVLNKARNAKYRYQKPVTRFVSSGKLLEKGEPVIHLLPDLIKPGTHVIDVGANCGAFAYVLCKMVKDGGRVYCVEPLKDLAQVIKKASEKLDLPVLVFNCGLSSKEGYAEFFVPYEQGRRIHACTRIVNENEENQKGEKFRIKLRRLDDLTEEANKKISFIKIDVEGHEFEVLKGGINTLKKHRPSLMIEIEKRHSHVPVSTTFEFLKELNYKGYYLDPQKKRMPLDSFDIRKHQIEQDNVFSPEYINNFIFVPAELNMWE